MEKKYKQLTLVERCQIETFSKHNHSARYRAKELKRANKTLSMELARCTPYRAERAHENALKRRCFAEKRIKHDDKMKEMIHELLSIHLTPEQISGRMRLEKHAFPICTNTIYRLIKANKWQNILPRKGKVYRVRTPSSAGVKHIPNRVDIDERPAIIDEKQEIGDF